MRALLAFILLVQVLVAQAGVPEASCLHAPGHSSHTSVTHASPIQATQASEHSGDASSHPPCCCTALGQCSSSAVDTGLASGALFATAVHLVSRAMVSVAPGFERLPYRPPSLHA